MTRRFDLAGADVPAKDEGTAFWSAEVTIPEDAYEMNYVFGDGAGAHDNNGAVANCSMMLDDGCMPPELCVW